MKHKLFFVLCMFPFFIFCQGKYDSIKTLYHNVSRVYDSLELKDNDINYLIEALNEFEPTYSKLLKIDDLSKFNLQKALIKNFGDAYSNAFTSRIDKTKSFKMLYGFDNKDDIYKYIEIGNAFLMNNISYSMSNAIFIDSQAKQKEINDYINENLKRLGVSRKEYDEMSDSDRELLIQQFK